MNSSIPSEPAQPPFAPRASFWLGGLGVALVSYLAVAARAVGSAAETAELAHLGLAGLLAMAALLASAQSALRPWLAALTVAWVVALWVLPQGLLRGSATGALLAIAWAVAALHGGSRRDALTSTQILGLSFALQALQRSDVLVTESGLKAAVILLLLPTVFGVSTARLQTLFGVRAVLAAMLVVTLAGQITLAATLLLAMAAATTMPSKLWSWSVTLLLAALAVVWAPALGTCLLLAALRLLEAPRWPAALMVLGGVLLAAAPVRVWDLPSELALLLLCAPLVWGAAAVARSGAGPLAAAAGLGVVGLRYLEPHEALLGPALLLGLEATAKMPRDAVQAQLLWSGTLLSLGNLLANYPWHRDVALGNLADEAWPPTLALVAVLVGQSRSSTLRNAVVVLSLLLFAGWPGLVGREVLLSWPPQVLDAKTPAWTAALPSDLRGRPLRVVLDSRLADARSLATGSPAATLELLDASGRALVQWPLRSGLETAEWAADRDGSSRPASFSSNLDASGSFFGRTYRAAFVGDAPAEAVALRLRRAASAEHDAMLEVHHVAVSRRLARRSQGNGAAP
ncbi:MAG: hypothetical protein AAGA81_11000 [Acidobacteriota bacterium]